MKKNHTIHTGMIIIYSSDLMPSPLKLRPYGAIEIPLLLLLLVVLYSSNNTLDGF